MYDFETLWHFIAKRSVGFPTVQEYHELEHVFNKMQGCESYLEVGSAEGNSLYVLCHALAEKPKVVSVDYGEKHTEKAKLDIILALRDHGVWVETINGNSHDPDVIGDASCDLYDCVLIDAGHSFADVIADATAYGRLAKKYIFFHDVCLPEVNAAFEWYCHQRPDCKAYRMINSTAFGYGIMEIQ